MFKKEREKGKYIVGFHPVADPDPEKGFAPISCELLEALARTELSGGARRVLDVIIRKTYGYTDPERQCKPKALHRRKESDTISLSQFEKITQLSRGSVIQSLSELQAESVIFKVVGEKRTSVTEYGLQTNYHQWGKEIVSEFDNAIDTGNT